MNEHDSEQLAGLLEADGMVPADGVEDADQRYELFAIVVHIGRCAVSLSLSLSGDEYFLIYRISSRSFSLSPLPRLQWAWGRPLH